MSRPVTGEPWGPSHQHMEPPFKHRHPVLELTGLFLGLLLVLFFLGLARLVLRSIPASLIGWTIAAIVGIALLRVLLGLVFSALTRTRGAPSSTRRLARESRRARAGTSRRRWRVPRRQRGRRVGDGRPAERGDDPRPTTQR
jgi:hypothetical protein